MRPIVPWNSASQTRNNYDESCKLVKEKRRLRLPPRSISPTSQSQSEAISLRGGGGGGVANAFYECITVRPSSMRIWCLLSSSSSTRFSYDDDASRRRTVSALAPKHFANCLLKVNKEAVKGRSFETDTTWSSLIRGQIQNHSQSKIRNDSSNKQQFEYLRVRFICDPIAVLLSRCVRPSHRI